MKDIAKEAEVSIATVSYVINNVEKENIKDETKKRVIDAVKKLNYHPDLAARSLARRETKLIGLFIPSGDSSTMDEWIHHYYNFIIYLEQYLSQSGYHIVVTRFHTNRLNLKIISERNLDGVILLAPPKEEFYSFSKQFTVPIMIVDSYVEDALFHKILSNEFESGYMAVQYLKSKGNTKIVFISKKAQDENPIRLGFIKAVDSLHIEAYSINIEHLDQAYDFGKKIFSLYPDSTGIIFDCGALAKAFKKGLEKSSNPLISIVCCGQQEEFKMVEGITVCTVTAEQKAQMAAQRIQEYIHHTYQPQDVTWISPILQEKV
jgi:DNA-binding LacI/PurR family transcriptional regulator